MDRVHNELPDLGGGVAGEVHILGHVVAGPDGGHVVRREADEPAVAVIGGRTGLAADGHAGQAGLGAGAAVDGVAEHVGHVPRGVGLESHDRARGILEHDLAAGILDIRIRAAVGEHAVVDEGGVRLRHLADGDAVRELAEGERRIVAVGLGKARDAELVLEELIRRARRELVEDLCRDGVERALQRLADGDDAVVAAAGVFRIPARAGELDVRRIVDLRVLRDEAELHGRAVGRDRLDGRSGRALGLRGPVRAEVDGLFAGAAGHALDLTGVGVHDDDGGLELLAGGRRALRHVVEVGINIVDRLLDARVIAGIDLIAAGIEQRARRVAADALLLDEVVEHVVDNGLGIVAVDGLGALFGLAAHEHELLRHGLVVLLLRDIALLVHLLEDGLLPGLIVLAADEGVVLRGVVRDADDARALGEREILRLLAEVGLGGGVDAVAPLAEVDDVQVPLHDLFLIIGLLKLERLEDLEQLALHGDIVLLGEVFDELLRDGRAAEVVFHRQEHVDERAGRAVPVDALVLVKALVLNGDGRVLHVLGDVGIIDPDAVFRAREVREVLPVAVGVLIQDRARERDREVRELHVEVRGQAVFHIVREDAQKQQPRDEHDQQDRAEHAQDRARDAHGRIRGPGRARGG